MKKMTYIILTLAAAIGLHSSAFAATVEIKAGLPSPVGNLQKLKLLNNSFAVGDTCNPGEIAMLNYVLYVCDSGGSWTAEPAATVWTQSGDQIYPTDSTNLSLKKVGIGTTNPLWKLHLDNGGSIFAKGTFGSGDLPNVADTMGAGTRFMWIPRKAAIRAGRVSGTQWDNTNIGNYSVAFGRDNRATPEYATISGGYNNTINTNGGTTFDGYATISGGYGNSSSSTYTVIAGGFTNSIGTGSAQSVISGGSTNVINNLVTGGTISGGFSNTLSGAGDVIGGGYSNSVNGGITGGSVIAGGYNNQINPGIFVSNYSVISGGSANVLSGPYQTIGGGGSHLINNGMNNTIGGGSANLIDTALGCTIGGGAQNNIQSGRSYATIAGGQSNVLGVSADWTVIGGGLQNNITGDKSAILGGNNNTINGNNSMALGSEFTINGDYSVGIGRGATIDGDGTYVFSNFDYLTDPYGAITANNAAIFMVTAMGVGTSPAALNPTTTLVVGGDANIEGNTTVGGTFTTGGDATIGGSLRAQLRTVDEIGMGKDNPVYFDIDGGTNELGYDIAELYDAREEVEIADLVEVSDDPNLSVQRTQQPYSKRVVGVVSIAPAILFEGKELQIAPKPGEFIKGKKPPVALAGRVLVKVSNENGAIERGDLLVSSSVPGHAMKATDKDMMTGAVVGKALEPFNKGKTGEDTGTVLMIVNLQ